MCRICGSSEGSIISTVIVYYGEHNGLIGGMNYQGEDDLPPSDCARIKIHRECMDALKDEQLMEFVREVLK